jgi:uncharacterized phage protein (TIGR02218 family)
MKKLSGKLQKHLSKEVITLATCWHLKLKDGKTMGFTAHDQDIKYNGLTYHANSGFTPSAVASHATVDVDNLDVEGILNSDYITESDIIAGKYDFAELEIFMLNYNNIQAGKLHLKRGWLGEVSFSRNYFVAEVRGLSQALTKNLGNLYSRYCRTSFGDHKCKVRLEQYTFQGKITKTIDNTSFEDTGLTNPDNFFTHGLIRFLSGANKRLKMEVKSYQINKIQLILPTPYPLSVGDIFDITAGCDKSFEACINKFNNALNFRGEPHIPGNAGFKQE